MGHVFHMETMSYEFIFGEQLCYHWSCSLLRILKKTRNKLYFMRNLLTFPDDFLKKIDLDLAFFERNIDIKLHLANCKVIFWSIQMQPLGPLQPHLWKPCSPSATSSLNLVMYITRCFNCQSLFLVCFLKKQLMFSLYGIWYIGICPFK